MQSDQLIKYIMAAAPRVAFAGQSIPAYARTVGRAVHVKIYPQPRNLAESTEVLRVLQQYGEVVMYKQLKVRFSTLWRWPGSSNAKENTAQWLIVVVSTKPTARQSIPC